MKPNTNSSFPNSNIDHAPNKTAREYPVMVMDERATRYGNAIYRIRDVKVQTPSAWRIQCQFATKDGDKVVWTDCRQGVSLDEIEPFDRLPD